jgi:hypothetical protein
MSMARQVVQILAGQGVAVALLHGGDRWDHGVMSSDIDLLVDRPLSEFADRFFHALDLAGSLPIVVWNYDVGATSVFVVDRVLDRAVQIDLNYDIEGAGRYGLRSAAVLQRVHSGVTPRIDDVDEWLYSIRKKVVKGQDERVRDLLANRPADAAALESRAAEVFVPQAAQSVRAAIRTGEISRRRPSHRIADYPSLGRRALMRIAHPVGFWVDLRGAPRDVTRASAHIEERSARILPAVDVLRRTWTRQVLSTPHAIVSRLKPRLVVSSGMQRPLAPVDLVLAVDKDMDRATSTLVHAMAARHAAVSNSRRGSSRRLPLIERD